MSTYRVEQIPGGMTELRQRFTVSQLAILEKLNRADLEHLAGLREVVLPESWVPDELAYSTMPEQYAAGEIHPKLLVVYEPGQMFGAYESGQIVRWGPVSSGARAAPTPAGLFHLNWRAVGHTSTVNPEWFMRWYFNFGNQQGLAFHEHSLPGRPASHGCVRLLERDAQWLFEWGNEWKLDDSGTRILKSGTPVFIVGAYSFVAPPPWRSPEWLAQTVELPPLPTVQQVLFHEGPFVAFQKSRHFSLLQGGNPVVPTCTPCHEYGGENRPSPKALESVCAMCSRAGRPDECPEHPAGHAFVYDELEARLTARRRLTALFR